MLLNEIAKSVAEKIDNEIAKSFVLNAGEMLIDQGIRLYIDYQKVEEEVIEDENKSEYHTTYNIKFAGIDTSEHDKQIKADAIDEFVDKFIKRTQLRQMTKAECINTMYVLADEVKEQK